MQGHRSLTHLSVLGLVALGHAVPQRFRQRQGRQDTGYLAPAPDAYGAPAQDAPALYAAPEEPVADASELDNAYLAPEASDVDTAYLAPAASDEAAVEADAPLDNYGAEEELGGYDELDTAASDVAGDEADPLKMLMNAVPGVPGEDYPIFSEAPETAFSCDGQIDGGKKISIRNGGDCSDLIQAIMLMKRPSVKYSTFAQLMELEVLPSTAFSAPTEPSSTRTISSVTGGSMLIALNQLPLLLKRTQKLLLLVKRSMLLLLTRLLHLSLMELTLLLRPTLHTLLLPKLLKMSPVDISLLPNMNMTMLKLLTVTLKDLTKEDSKNVP